MASITGPSGSAGDASSVKSIDENTTAVHTFTADESVTWSLNGGDDAAKFSIDSSGALVFQSAPDFENPSDLGDTANNNTYVVIVRATDAANNTSDQTVTVTVSDADEIAPKITGITIKKENSALSLFLFPKNNEVHIVAPDLEMPGKIAKA